MLDNVGLWWCYGLAALLSNSFLPYLERLRWIFFNFWAVLEKECEKYFLIKKEKINR
jgi:hypothetical protein